MTAQPRTLRGFRDLLPDDARRMEEMVSLARSVFKTHGYVPIETPAIEYLDVLQAKAGEESDRLIYQFKDAGEREIGLRFDLTVPFARFVSEHQHRLTFPFKRYQVGLVWRGENPQRGRYREFYQCDFDIIGAQSGLADIETIVTLCDALCSLRIENFTIRLSDRQVANAMLRALGVQHLALPILRAIDKVQKQGTEKVQVELRDLGLSQVLATNVLRAFSLSGTNEEKLAQAGKFVADSDSGTDGIRNLSQLLDVTSVLGLEKYLSIDFLTVRGMDYYTGIVFEAYVDSEEAIGAVASGGRYSDLTQHFTSRPLAGVGGSLGLDRIAAVLRSVNVEDHVRPSVVIFNFGETYWAYYIRMATELRQAGITVDIYLGQASLRSQMKWANKQRARIAVFFGPEEMSNDRVQLRDLAFAMSREVPWHEMLSVIRSILNCPGRLVPGST